MQLANFSRAVVSGLSVTFLSGLCATAALAASTGCVVGVSPGKDLNLRAGPGLRFQIVGGIPADTCGVAISTDCVNGFCRVWDDADSGWASEGFLRRNAKASDVPDLVWVPLGARNVNMKLDRDVIKVGRSDGRFRALQLLVSDNDIFIIEMHVVYGNGQSETIPMQEELKAGRRSQVLDLAGRARKLQSVELIYRSDASRGRPARVELFGVQYDPNAAERTEAKRKPRQRGISVVAAPALNWELLGTQSVQGKQDVDTVKIGRRDGTFRAIQLAVRESDIDFSDLKIVYGNGRIQDVPIRELIRAGATTRVIDLRGKDRFLKEVQFTYRKARKGYQRAAVDVYGLSSSGGVTRVAQTRVDRPERTQASHLEVGILNCEVSGGIGFIVGSTKNLTCKFNRPGRDERYYGTIERFGLDIGVSTKAVMSWAVLANTNDIPPGALVGNFAGVSGEATVGVGLGAKALVGGSNKSIVLQPVSVQAQLGLNLALGVTELKLRR